LCSWSDDSQLKWLDGGGFVGPLFIFGGDGVACQRLGRERQQELLAGRGGRQPVFLAGERQDDRHSVVDVADYLICIGGEDGEVHRVLFSRVESRRLARLDARHGERLAGLQRDTVGLFAFANCLPLIVAVGEHEAVAAAG
jgi:hypothetical protein